VTGYSGWSTWEDLLVIRNGEGGGGTSSSWRSRGVALHGQSGNHTDVTDARIDGFDDPILVGPGSVLIDVTANGVPVTTAEALVGSG